MERNDRVQTTAEVSVSRYDSPPDFLPDAENGGKIPLEVFAFQEFYRSRQGQSTSLQVGDDSFESSSSLPASVPKLSPARRVPREFSEHIQVDASGPQTHYLADVEFEQPFVALFLFVVRPEQRYIFTASYLAALPPTVARRPRTNCFGIATETFDLHDDPDDLVRDRINKEIAHLLANRKSPMHPAMGELKPLIKRHARLVAGGAIIDEWEPTEDRRTIRIDERGLSDLSPPHAVEARDFLLKLMSRLPATQGRKRDYDRAEVRQAYESLLEPCSRLLDSVAGRPWPPYRRETSGLPLVQRHLEGEEEDLKRISALLARGGRRPRPRDLALRILAVKTGYTLTALRDIIRKK